ncbi:MAG: carotenoid biosynthesis protein [Verrucomicrobiaceae bacterium]|nr:MAG: carotenoid biosynthesis protein [Verrucomicrobiaceae bacterium]
MRRIFWILFFSCSAAGLILSFLPPGSWPWWDSSWILLFFVATYAGMVESEGLSATRMTAGIVLVSMAVLLGLGALTGWPVGPLRFTEHSGLRLGGAIPLALPLFAFALLTASGQAAAAAMPGSGRTGLAIGTAVAFLVTIANGTDFLVSRRIWWLWNPWGDGHAPGRIIFSFLVLGAAAAILSFAYPVHTSMRRTRWNAAVIAWLSINLLFLAARLATLLP